jgi:hypothetical protein
MYVKRKKRERATGVKQSTPGDKEPKMLRVVQEATALAEQPTERTSLLTTFGMFRK